MLSLRNRTREPRKRVVIIISLTLLGLVLLFFIQLFLLKAFTFNTVNAEFSAETTDRTILQTNAELQIPQSATEIRGYVDGFRDLTTYVRFVVPASDFDQFAESISCVLPLSTTDAYQRWQDSSKLTWWKPSRAQNFRQCDGSKEHLFQRVFVDTAQIDHYIVYVVASTK